MKNLLTKLGNKKVAGVILAGATLMVGLGVVNNFSGGSQKAANEAALSRFADNSYNKFGSSSSRADLERQMSAGQDMNTARFMRGNSPEGISEDDAYSSDGAYAEGVRGDEGFVYGAYEGGGTGTQGGDYMANDAGDAYQPFDATYEQSLNASDASSADVKDTTFGEKQFNAVQAEAAAAVGKGAAGKNGAKGVARSGVRPSTQVNKMGSSNGSGSSFGNGTGGSKGGGAGDSSLGGAANRGDSSTRALPQNNAGARGGQSFKFGRSGSMDTYQASRDGGKSGQGGNIKGGGAAQDLLRASQLSSKAIAKQGEASKSSAEAAFDGQETDVIGDTIEQGATISRVASTLSDVSSNSNLRSPMSGINNAITEIDTQMEALQKLNKDIRRKYVWTLIFTLALGLLASSFLVSGITGDFLALGTAFGIFLWGYNMIGRRVGLEGALNHEIGPSSIIGMIQQMGDTEKFGLINSGIDVTARVSQAMWFGNLMKTALALTAATGIGGAIAMIAKAKSLDGIFKGLKEDNFKDESEEFSKYDKYLEDAKKLVENEGKNKE